VVWVADWVLENILLRRFRFKAEELTYKACVRLFENVPIEPVILTELCRRLTPPVMEFPVVISPNPMPIEVDVGVLVFVAPFTLVITLLETVILLFAIPVPRFPWHRLLS
jgi:hypothetical protein